MEGAGEEEGGSAHVVQHLLLTEQTRLPTEPLGHGLHLLLWVETYHSLCCFALCK